MTGYLRIERDIIEAAYKQEYDSYDAMLCIQRNGWQWQENYNLYCWQTDGIISTTMKNDKNTLREVSLDSWFNPWPQIVRCRDLTQNRPG